LFTDSFGKETNRQLAVLLNIPVYGMPHFSKLLEDECTPNCLTFTTLNFEKYNFGVADFY